MTARRSSAWRADLLARFGQPVLVEDVPAGPRIHGRHHGHGRERRSAGGERDRPQREIHRPWLWLSRTRRQWEDRLEIRLADDATARAAGAMALAAWRALRCRDGGRVDIRCDAQGTPQFIEVNPLAGIRPGYSDLCFIADFAGPRPSAIDRKIPGFVLPAPSGPAPDPRLRAGG